MISNPSTLKNMSMLKKKNFTASEAILEATDQIMKKDKNLIIIGEGVNDPKGIFGTTINLHEKYGKVRIIESPISENGVTGIAIGLAINNFKVLLIHQICWNLLCYQLNKFLIMLQKVFM